MNEDLKSMQQRLLDSERLKAMADLAGATVREFRQPLRAMQGRTEDILRSLQESHPAYHHVKELSKEISQLGEALRHIEKITKMRQIVEKEGQREKEKEKDKEKKK